MDQAQLDRELIKLASLTSEAKTRSISQRICWVDGSECPYGRPEGQFLFRPRQFCRPTGECELGCRIMDDNTDNLMVVARKLQQKETERALSTIMEEQALSLSGEVGAVADNEKDEKKKGILKLAAVIIEEREKGAKDPFIVKIFREDDFAGALEKELGIKIRYR